MLSKSIIYQTLNIKKGESKPIFLLFIYSFFMGVGYAFFYTPSTSLFLEYFTRADFPLAYIISGIFAFALGIPLKYIQKRIKYSRFVPGVIMFLLIVMLLSILSINFLPGLKAATYYFLFVFARVFVFIMGISFWGVAGKLFDLRQSKRIFSLINTGEVLSFLISYLSIPFILKIQGIKTQQLLIFSFIALILAYFFMISIVTAFSNKLSEKTEKSKIIVNKEKGNRSISNKKYYQLIYFLAFMPIISLIFTDYIFFSQSQINYKGQVEALSSFLAIVFGINALFEFIIKTFLSGKLISNYGVKLGLLSLPVVMGLCIFLASVTGSFELTIGLFFPFVTLSKLLLRSVRTTLYDPTFQIMFQPIPVDERTEFQSKIEAGPRSLGNIISGVILLCVTFFSFFELVHFTYIYFVIIVIWFYLSVRMFNEYRITLKSIIEQKKNHTKDIIGKSNYQILSEQLTKAKASNYRLILNLIDKIEPAKVDTELFNSLNNLSFTEKKQKALSEVILNQLQNHVVISTIPILKEKIKTLTDINSIEKIDALINILEKSKNLSLEELSILAKSEKINERILAAKLIGQSKRYNAYKLTKILLLDKDTRVKREALITSGKIKRDELWHLVIENLSSPAFANTASAVILMIGEPILRDLDYYFERMSDHKEPRLNIIQIYEAIGGETAISLLRNKINYPDKDIRYRVLNALSNLGYHPSKSEIPYINQAIEDEIAIFAWLIASLYDLGKSKDVYELTDALKFELKLTNERIFILLSLLYDSKTVKLVEENLVSGDNESKGYALEIIDMLIPENLKKLILPTFEFQNYKELLENYKYTFPQQKLSKFERIQEIILKDFSRINKWTKALAIEMLTQFEKQKSRELLAANVMNFDQFMLEVSTDTLYKIDPEYLDFLASGIQVRKYKNLHVMIQKVKHVNQNKLFSILDKIRLFRNSMFFSIVPELSIIKLALNCNEINLKKDEEINFVHENENLFYVLIDGEIGCFENGNLSNTFEQSSIISEITELESLEKSAQYKATMPSKLLSINIDLLYEIMAHNVEITHKITNIIKLQSITKKYD